MNRPATFDPNKMIQVVSREGEGYVDELRFRDKFRHPNGEVAHSYQVTFKIPHNRVEGSKLLVNRLMAKIETAMINEADVNFNGYGRHRRDWMDDEFLKEPL